MFFFKFSFILTILAFFFMTATALPVAFAGSEVASAPGSLLGRTYVQRAASVGSVPAVNAAREAETGDVYYGRAPEAEASTEEFVPLKRSERFQRRMAGLNRLDSQH
ncbi:hypothetical protein MD484_g6196, partial [Candolleomyces efflorescens]